MFLKKLKNNLEYFKVKFIIMLKVLKEYKANFWGALTIEFIYIPIYLLFFYVLSSNFSFLDWNFKDFILFFSLFRFFETFGGIIGWKNYSLGNFIARGEFNNILSRPKNSLLFFLTYDLENVSFLISVIDFLLLLIVIIFFKIKLYHIFLGFILSSLIIIYRLLFNFFIYFLDFISFGLSQLLNPIHEINRLLKRYPAIFFKDFSYKILMNFFPAYFTAVILIPVLRKKYLYLIPGFFFQIKLFFISFIFFIVAITILWNYGMKKYNAYG